MSRPAPSLRLLISLAGLSLTPSMSFGATYFVAPCGNDGWLGFQSSCSALPIMWRPKQTIQAAVNAATDGDTILVLPGTYGGSIDLLGKAIAIQSTDGPVVTIIDGEEAERGFICDSGEGPDTVIEGFTVLDCRAIGSSGGGIYNFLASPTIIDCVFNGNTGEFNGGGAFNFVSNATYMHCSFLGNLAVEAGGGVYNFGGSVEFVECFFACNQARSGGGMHIEESTVGIDGCVFSCNTTVPGPEAYGGGAIRSVDADLVVTTCDFMSNSAQATTRGGALRIDGGAAFVETCDFTENFASGGGAIFTASGTTEVSQCLFDSNQANSGAGLPGGGAIFATQDSDVTIDDCDFLENYSLDDGGAITASGFGSLEVSACLFEANETDATLDRGGGAIRIAGFVATITGCTFVDNVSQDEGGALTNENSATTTITGSVFIGNAALDGGAIYNEDDAELTIDSCTLNSNGGFERGGGLSIVTGEVAIIDSILLKNGSATDGGGIYAESADLTIESSVLEDNFTQDGHGGAIYTIGTDGVFTACQFLANETEGGFHTGGALRSTTGSKVSAFDCIFIGNTSGNGAVAEVDANSDSTFIGCTFDGNVASNLGGALRLDGGEHAIADCVFVANQAEVGGAISVFSDATLTNCQFTLNHAEWMAGALDVNDSDPLVSGCSFNGNTAASDDAGGGAVRVIVGSPVFTACSFSGNNTPGRGGAMFLGFESQPVIDACTFTGNGAAIRGGAILTSTTAVASFIDCVLEDNVSGDGGAVSAVDDSQSTWTRCRFIANAATNGGGVHASDDSVVTAVNVLLSGNTATNGAAVYGDMAAVVDLTSSTVTGNAAGGTGGGLYQSGADISAANCIIWNNPGGSLAGFFDVSYCLVEGGAAGPGNVDADPLFTDFDGADDVPGNTDDDLRPLAGSPAIDAGANALVPAGVLTDLGGNARFVDDPFAPDTGEGEGEAPLVDMGAWERQPGGSPDINGDGVVDGIDLGLLLANWGMPGPTDINGDGTTDGIDLGILLASWS